MEQDLPVTPIRTIGSYFFLFIRLLSILTLIAAGVLVYLQWARFNQEPAVLPPGSNVAGIPLGGLEREEALQRVQQAYTQPVEARINGASFWLDPLQAGFQLNFDRMLPQPPAQDRWQSFRDYLWERRAPPLKTELDWSYDPDALRAYLEDDVAPRYNLAAMPPAPLPGRIGFQPGQIGVMLDIDASIPLIAGVLPVLSNRTVDLPTLRIDPPAPSLANLPVMLKQSLRSAGFEALADVYVIDLKTGQAVQVAVQQGQEISTQPDIAFTASSIIKIPILVSVFRRLSGAPDANVDGWLHAMIESSSNEAADALMKQVLGEVRGPLLVTEDLQKLGFQNTFLAGYFALGSPLLERYQTPANQRSDVNTQPDLYNQTTPSDIGTLLSLIYQCASNGSGRLAQAFPGEITQEKCRQILEYIKLDRQPYLIMTGLPEGTPLAHKHGYGSVHDVITTIGDAGIVFSPGGDYVLVGFFNNPQLLLFDPVNALIGNLSTVVYNYFNPPPPG